MSGLELRGPPASASQMLEGKATVNCVRVCLSVCASYQHRSQKPRDWNYKQLWATMGIGVVGTKTSSENEGNELEVPFFGLWY